MALKRSMKLDDKKTEKVAKPKNMMFLKSEKENLTMINLTMISCGTLQHEELKARKRKQHKCFSIIPGHHQNMRGEKKIRIKKKKGLELEFRHLKHRFKKASFMHV